jgi:nitroimidazol reductase NimA-like FMN-containing flavoprotein (pyridoxamine 5'-phosphate oxidase superfamily)
MHEPSTDAELNERRSSELVRSIIDHSAYMTLATADAEGVPWATPVWYAPESYTRLLWISRPDARHSRNITVQPQTGIVIFDSGAAIGTGQGVYIEAISQEVPQEETERAISTFSARSRQQGGETFGAADVSAPAPHRLYRASATQVFIGIQDFRTPVSVH